MARNQKKSNRALLTPGLFVTNVKPGAPSAGAPKYVALFAQSRYSDRGAWAERGVAANFLAGLGRDILGSLVSNTSASFLIMYCLLWAIPGFEEQALEAWEIALSLSVCISISAPGSALII